MNISNFASIGVSASFALLSLFGFLLFSERGHMPV